MGFEVSDLKAVIEDLRRRGVTFEAVDVPGFERQGEMVVVPNNYPSKGSGELGAFFYDSEGNMLRTVNLFEEVRPQRMAA